MHHMLCVSVRAYVLLAAVAGHHIWLLRSTLDHNYYSVS